MNYAILVSMTWLKKGKGMNLKYEKRTFFKVRFNFFQNFLSYPLNMACSNISNSFATQTLLRSILPFSTIQTKKR